MVQKKKKMSIPKKIHYCWFGGNPLPESALFCIESWKKFCPDYEIKEWNESNVNINESKFMRDAYEQKKWAFVSDFARYNIINENGGIYLDTDVEIIKNFDTLLSHTAFMGFEGREYVNSGLGFGAVKGCKIIKEILELYESIDFKEGSKNLGNIATPILVTSLLEKRGLVKNGEMQTLNELTVFPEEYFSPKNPITRLVNITENTFSIHHYDATWVDVKEREYIDELEKNAKEVMEKQPNKVSIIIPVYNGSDYLREAIDSALAQTYKNIEVIVINDGSKDNSEEIAKSYGNSIRYFKKENGGVASALNMGIEKMQGHYFAWLSHDDVFHPEKIEKQVEFASNYDDQTIVVSNWAIINAQGDFVKKQYLDRKLEELTTCFLAFDRKTWLNGCAMLIPKTIFKKFGNFNENLKSTQDYDFWFRLSRKIKFKIIPNHLLYSRAHENQGSLKMPSAIFDSDSIHSKIIRDLSVTEVKQYFNGNIKDILTVYNSFYLSGYKITPAYILNLLVKILLSVKEEKKINELLSKELLGDLNFTNSDNKQILSRIKAKKTKKRLFFCSAHWFTGGVERVLTNLFKNLSKDYDIILITPETEVKSCIKIPRGVMHIKISNDQFLNHYDSIIFTFALLLNVDVVIGCMNLFEKMSNFYHLAKQGDFKTIASNHEYYFLPYKNEYFHQIVEKRQKAFKMADAVIWLTNFSAAVYNNYNENGCLIPNPNTFAIQKNDIKVKKEKIVLCVGRFDDPIKRIDRILKCFKIVLSKVPEAKLVLVGRANRSISVVLEENKTIDDLLKELDLSEKEVSFEGEVNNIQDYYANASLLLLASENEGFPMILNEAACFGLPIVCNHIPGIEDIVSEGENGYIVAQEDIETMSEKVSQILVDDALRVKLGKKAKELAGRFELEIVTQQWSFLIELLLGDLSVKEQRKLFKKNLGFQIQDYKHFSKVLSQEINSIFQSCLKNKGVQDTLPNGLTIRSKLINMWIKLLISIKDDGLKSTSKKILKSISLKLKNI